MTPLKFAIVATTVLLSLGAEEFLPTWAAGLVPALIVGLAAGFIGGLLMGFSRGFSAALDIDKSIRAGAVNDIG